MADPVAAAVRSEIEAWWQQHWPLAGWPSRRLVEGRLEPALTLDGLSERIVERVTA